ncbi:MAG: hypothetical protein GC162_12500 [Planctomycetes bacterium]|nr:hypothetical protein [Planctomycetota bacterium]
MFRSAAAAVMLFLASLAHAQTVERVGGDFAFVSPFSIDFRGPVAFVAEFEGGRIHRIDLASNTVTTLGGKLNTKGNAGDNAPISEAVFNGVHNLAVDPRNGDVYIADTWNTAIRKLDAKTGLISTVLKEGQVFCLDFDTSGEHLYMADLQHRRIRVLNMTTGEVATLAGNGQKGAPDDGAMAKDAPLVDPRAAAVDGKGNVYILERNANALRVVDPAGHIRTVVNAAGKKGASGDGGPAIDATMNGPKHICIDRDNSVIIADAENHLIRRYDPTTGLITRVAGTGKKGDHFSTNPLELELNRPHGVAVAPNGDLYVCDSYNNRVLRIKRK